MPRPLHATILLLLALTRVATASELPDLPAIERDVALIRANAFTYPHIPPLRTTADGRVGIGPLPIHGKVRFYVIVPEALSEPFVTSAPGAAILAGATPYEVPETSFHTTADASSRHYALCDTTTEFPKQDELTNPYACGSNKRDDCYDFTVITSTSLGRDSRRRQLWGTLVTVRISDPKTVNAAIAQITLDEPRSGSELQAIVLFEPQATSDGRLFSGRVDTLDYEWTHPGTNAVLRQHVNLVYSLNDTSAPCDVRAWKEFHPISHAPYDDAVRSRYGFAMQPFRDSTGVVLPDGADLGITYPWIDRKGRNLFFTSIGALLAVDGRLPANGNGATIYPARCVPGIACSEKLELFDRTRGQAVAGLWTRGKMVLFDGILNNTDFGLEVDEGGHRLVELYRSGSGPDGDQSGEVRLGTGRSSSGPSVGPPAYIGNANIADSLENLHHAFLAMRPVTPRDVTWIVNNGKASDEIAFDDWLDLDAMIVSSMVGSTSFRPVGAGGAMIYHHGWAGLDLRNPIWIQNAATATPDRWKVPPMGVAYGNARLEHAALGGARGKGLWLDGVSGIEYDIGAQPVPMDERPWYFGIFLDSRFDDDGRRRTIVGFPNGARILLRGREAVLYSAPDGSLTGEVQLPAALPHGAWTHLGFQLTQTGRVTSYVDGFAYDRTAEDTGLRLSPGKLFVGDDPRDSLEGVRAWIDELVVIARELAPEPACNQAFGTLAALPVDRELASADERRWRDVADGYPAWAHRRIAAQLGVDETEERYVCFHGYDGDYDHHPATLPSSLRALRDELTFPEGPLIYGEPRPDSTANAFCLTCHSPDGRGGLGVDALAETPAQSMEDDIRRQPTQPFRRAFGNIPADWLGRGLPPHRVEAPATGLKVEGILAGLLEADESEVTAVCHGDCDRDRNVSIGELVRAVRIALGAAPFASCRRAFECGASDNCITIGQLTRAVRSSINGCTPP